MTTLNVMVGVPGSGKSTFIKKNSKQGDIVISRDEIRYSILKDDDDYFSHENEVLNMFYSCANFALDSKHNTWVDATHMSPKSRRTLLSHLHMQNVDVLNFYAFNIPLETALERNSLRSGRACVPEYTIRSMYVNYSIPNYKEFSLYTNKEVNIYEVAEDGSVRRKS